MRHPQPIFRLFNRESCPRKNLAEFFSGEKAGIAVGNHRKVEGRSQKTQSSGLIRLSISQAFQNGNAASGG